MPITSVSSDTNTLTLTVVGDYPVPVERLWEAYADPRQLERFWGPETWPATFTRHDILLSPTFRWIGISRTCGRFKHHSNACVWTADWVRRSR